MIRRCHANDRYAWCYAEQQNRPSIARRQTLPDETPAAFFSYSRQDKAFAQQLAADLKAAGANVWMDELDIEPGTVATLRTAATSAVQQTAVEFWSSPTGLRSRWMGSTSAAHRRPSRFRRASTRLGCGKQDFQPAPCRHLALQKTAQPPTTLGAHSFAIVCATSAFRIVVPIAVVPTYVANLLALLLCVSDH